MLCAAPLPLASNMRASVPIIAGRGRAPAMARTAGGAKQCRYGDIWPSPPCRVAGQVVIVGSAV
jgi:hypothetical protein